MCNTEEDHRRINGELQVKLTQLQERIDKAIEYIKDNYDKVTRIEYDNNFVKETRYINNFDIEILLNILKGDSDE